MSGTSISLLPGDRFALVSWHFGNLGILDLSDGSMIVQMEGNSQDGENVLIRDVVVSKDGQWALSCATANLAQGTGNAKLWRIGNGAKSP